MRSTHLIRVAAIAAALTPLAGCGGGGVDVDELAASVKAVADENFELEDDFQSVSDCELRDGTQTYECKATGDDGDLFFDVEVLDDGTFRVSEPEYNFAFDGTIGGEGGEDSGGALNFP